MVIYFNASNIVKDLPFPKIMALTHASIIIVVQKATSPLVQLLLQAEADANDWIKV